MLVVAERVHGGDAVLVIAAENQRSRLAVVVQKFLLRDLPLLLFDHAVLLLFLFLAAAVVGGGGGLSLPIALADFKPTPVMRSAAAAKIPMPRSTNFRFIKTPC